MTQTPDIRILHEKISAGDLAGLVKAWFEDMVKVVIDIEKGVVAIGGDLHADAEQLLIEAGSDQQELWGANVYPFLLPEQRIEYTALINIRPSQDNPFMEIGDEVIRNKARNIIETLVIGPDETLV